jgi:hypothetical protein
MASELPYLSSYKNVAELFKRIESAKQPDTFTTRYLSETLGLKSATDRQLIALLKALGFVDNAGRPTAEYGGLKNQSKAAHAIAGALRQAYSALYAANENAHALNATELKGLIAQVAGSDSGMTSKIFGTFSSLVKLANFSEPKAKEPPPDDPDKPGERTPPPDITHGFGALRPEFHYNIQVHLPANAAEETYLNIFNALRKAFKS